MADTKEPKPVPAQFPAIPDLYTNIAKINYNHHEFEVTFAVASSNYEGVRPVVNMRMTPQFAKDFLQALKGTLEGYEKSFGDIRQVLPDKTPLQ